MSCSFPWSIDHGLIEAAQCSVQLAPLIDLSWSIDHGLIEAWVAEGRKAAAERFPWSMITASLKR